MEHDKRVRNKEVEGHNLLISIWRLICKHLWWKPERKSDLCSRITLGSSPVSLSCPTWTPSGKDAGFQTPFEFLHSKPFTIYHSLLLKIVNLRFQGAEFMVHMPLSLQHLYSVLWKVHISLWPTLHKDLGLTLFKCFAWD